MKWYGLLAGLTVITIVMGYMVMREGVYFLGNDNHVSWQIDQKFKREILKDSQVRKKRLIVIVLKTTNDPNNELIVSSVNEEILYRGGWQEKWWGDKLTINIMESEYARIDHKITDIMMYYFVWGEVEKRLAIQDDGTQANLLANGNWIKLKERE